MPLPPLLPLTPPSDDDHNNVTLTAENGQKLPCRTTWTLLLYLTSSADGCEGGETVFYPNDRKLRKEEVAVSSATGEGIRDLLQAVAIKLDEIKADSKINDAVELAF